MNILIVAFNQVYPLTTGASVSQFGIIEYLSNLCNVSLLLPDRSTITDKEFIELNQLLPKVKVYIADEQYKLSTAYDLKSSIYDFLRDFRDKTTVLLKFLLKGTKNVEPASSEEVFVDVYTAWNPFYVHSQKYVETVNEIILRDQIEIVQLEHAENLNLVTFIPSHVKKVFVEHECIFYRIKSHINARRIESVFGEYIMNFYKSVELSLLEKFDGVLTFNNTETELLKNALGDKKDKIEFALSPFPILERDFKEINIERFGKLTKLIFVGGEHHYPNKDAVEWFLEEVAVEVFRKLGLRLYVVGKWSLNTIKAYKNHPSGVHFVGYIEDLYEFSKDSISIAPVRIGGGLKTKIMLAMAQGIPVICTKFALEGINAKHQESVMIADDQDSFCSSIEYLQADGERTSMICQNAQDLMRQGYSQAVVSEFRYSFCQNLLKSKELSLR